MRTGNTKRNIDIDWHCPKCEYLHIKDRIYDKTTMDDGNIIVSAKCIVCNELATLQTLDEGHKWRWNNAYN